MFIPGNECSTRLTRSNSPEFHWLRPLVRTQKTNVRCLLAHHLSFFNLSFRRRVFMRRLFPVTATLLVAVVAVCSLVTQRATTQEIAPSHPVGPSAAVHANFHSAA